MFLGTTMQYPKSRYDAPDVLYSWRESQIAEDWRNETVKYQVKYHGRLIMERRVSDKRHGADQASNQCDFGQLGVPYLT